MTTNQVTAVRSLSAEQHARLAHTVMQRQARLSISVAVVFIVLLFGVPLVNFYLPGVAGYRLFGFTLTWLFIGIVFFPITWALSAYFVKASDRIEAECADYWMVLANEAGRPVDLDGTDDVKPAFTAIDGTDTP